MSSRVSRPAARFGAASSHAPKCSGLKIRGATIDDLPTLVQLLSLLFKQEAEFSPSPRLQRSSLRRILHNPSLGLILVLEVDGHVQGMASLLFTVSTALGGRVALFEDFVITPQLRGKGYGKLLLLRTIAKARRLGLRRLALLTDSSNHRAQRLYESVGFTRSAMVPMRTIL